MRRLLFTLITVTITSSSVALANDDGFFKSQPRNNMLLVNPGDLFSGVLSVEYERGVAPWLGVTLGLSVATFRGLFNYDQPHRTTITPELGFRFHFIRHAPGGLWIGPSVTAGAVIDEGREAGRRSRGWSWGFGAAFGYNFVVGRYFTFQLGAGGGFVDYGDRIRWDPRLKLGVGASF